MMRTLTLLLLRVHVEETAQNGSNTTSELEALLKVWILRVVTVFGVFIK